MYNLLELCNFIADVNTSVTNEPRGGNLRKYRTTNYSHKDTLDQLLFCLVNKGETFSTYDDYNRDIVEYDNAAIKAILTRNCKKHLQVIRNNKYNNDIVMYLCEHYDINIFVCVNNTIIKVYYYEDILYLDKQNVVLAINTDHITSETHIQNMFVDNIRDFILDGGNMVFAIGSKKIKISDEKKIVAQPEQLVSLSDSLWLHIEG